MAITTTGSLADSRQLIIDSARITREFEGVFMRTTDAQKLPEGTGLDWNEISLAALTGQSGITLGSFVEAWIAPADTATNTADNHWIEGWRVVAGSIQAGVGFTIYAAVNQGLAHGQYNVSWVWT